MFYQIWPEGQPSRHVKSTSFFKIWLTYHTMWVRMLFGKGSVRRLRLTECEKGYISPEHVEYCLYLKNAIPPPGGWTICNNPEFDKTHVLLEDASVCVRTFSVI